ncbi:Unknown protein [Striga hermonthica]|uniref:START domain-containing protein n=1 Tax=Striga hermonthica TaxID=68872 RepID=A0A9N7MZZ3_STRHE|nr:Unknown protein [Striga hermonthica]
MEEKDNISDYRSKLDKTLTSPDLTNYENIRTHVKNQILQSLECDLEEYTEHVVEKRSKEMFSFLSMLRSASVSDLDKSKSINESQSCWKLKEDTDEFRVMYREGPAGTPFHTLLVEGYVDGPLDVCLCISCESDLYKIWWPQSAVPTFKVVQSQCVQKVRLGEQISVVRMKLSWPLSSREALVHFYVLEYFQDGLIVVLLNSISDFESIEKSTHGFTRDGIPDAEDVVRIDVVGGFALQKVTEDRSYFRTIANMDIKLDFVPPAFINFISRQLVGSGFKLYKKEVASASKGDQKFLEALRDPMYIRVREALYSKNTPLTSNGMFQEQSLEARKNNNNSNVENHETEDLRVRERKSVSEIEELEEKKEFTTQEITEEVETDDKEAVITNELGRSLQMANSITKQFAWGNVHKIGIISPRVREALMTLDKAISILREHNNNNNNINSRQQHDDESAHDDEKEEELFISLEADQIRKKDEDFGEPSKIGSVEKDHVAKNNSDSHESRPRHSNSYSRDTKPSKIAPDESPTNSHSYAEQITFPTAFENITENLSCLNDDSKFTKGKGVTKRKSQIPKFCCFVAR